ncbi:MAG: hypothetical protein ACTSSA_13630 [Candidatus Freyarchaeota archaeon]
MKPKLRIKTEGAKNVAEAMGFDFNKVMATVTAIFFTHNTNSACLSELWDKASTPEEAMLFAFLLGKWTGFLEKEFSERGGEG